MAAPNGTATADKIVEANDVGKEHQISRDLGGSPSDNTSQTISFFAKAVGRTEISIQSRDKSNDFDLVDYDISAGTVTVENGATGTIEEVPDGWFRRTYTFDAVSGGTAPRVFIRLLGPSSADTYNGDGFSGAHVWGIQLEIDQATASDYSST